MKINLINHNYKYAVEQMMLTMFPRELPVYDEEGDSPLSASVKLSHGDIYATAHTRIFSKDAVYDGSARTKRLLLTDKLCTDRLLQKIVKLSFYKAAVKVTEKKPVWGALTGIRPGKLVTNMLEHGIDEFHAKRTLMREYYVSEERSDLCIATARAGLSVKKNLRQHDIALYIGIPFCPTRCSYCSFVSQSVEKSLKQIEPFLTALNSEITASSEIIRQLGLNVISVYVGGGTPTTLTALQLELLMNKIASSFDLSSVREYTVEAGRPDTITSEKLAVLQKNGVTRISINPQTMSDHVLRTIGRNHTSQDVLFAFEKARQQGFDCINMDLIAGLPTDSFEGFKNTLDAIIHLNPENITIHTLSRKKGSRVSEERSEIPDGAAVSQMLDYTADLLYHSGYFPYYLYRQKFMSGGFENIGWCKKGFESLYNICIMEELCTILSLGGGGVTKLVDGNSGKIERIFNAKYPNEYIQGIEKIIKDKEYMKKFYHETVFKIGGN